MGTETMDRLIRSRYGCIEQRHVCREREHAASLTFMIAFILYADVLNSAT